MKNVGESITPARGKYRGLSVAILAVDPNEEKYVGTLADGTIVVINDKNVRSSDNARIPLGVIVDALVDVRGQVGISHKAIDKVAEALGVTVQLQEALAEPAEAGEKEPVAVA